MASIIWGIDPLAASRAGKAEGVSPLSRAALEGIGVPARKVERVQAELARLAATGKIDERALPQLALEIAGQLL